MVLASRAIYIYIGTASLQNEIAPRSHRFARLGRKWRVEVMGVKANPQTSEEEGLFPRCSSDPPERVAKAETGEKRRPNSSKGGQTALKKPICCYTPI